ncbi:Methyltransf-25 domain-containing protein [Mycena venus]|uniref:Methyltransf-25 domain-containing protein n=1 Tax=Mycena venus TaxID=2733690 RepID=A0A8H6X9Z0_9AGAR|nr:Methyltransf-25 domain-containing protein [Mycena venus]
MAPPPSRQPPPFGAAPQPPQKDVQAILLKQRTSRRRPGEVPYPLDYSADMINFDNWDQMFLQSCFGGLTAHHFDETPQVILDLGCGSGFWAMEAAKQWPNAQIIGFDLKDIQPELFQLDASYMRCLEDCGLSPKPLPIANEIASRVRWVHGNLLDGLPFPSEYFDFVHISGIGLGVPEDEWQSVLEEVSRVMMPNGILEIIEEDLIFPCVPPRPSRLTLPPLSLDFIPRERKDSAPPSAFSSRSSNTMFSDPWNSPESPDEHRVQKKPSLPTLPETNSDSSHHRDSIPYEVGSINLEPSLTRRETTFFPQDMEVVTPDHHPEDHTRLKTAWDAMLSRRFLASSVITVLPFYLSSFFENVQTHPSLQIQLPPSSTSPDTGSRSSDDSFDADTLFDLNPSATRLGDADMYSIKSKSTRSSQRSVPFWGRMHLAKTVNTVSACKEAVWAEYKQLFPGDLPPIISNTVRPSQRYRPLKHSPREAFETDWMAWEHDMADRISMRGRVTSEFGWAEPEPSPDWRVWRTRMSQYRGEPLEERPRSSANNLCRSLRAFVGTKPDLPYSP